MTRRRLLILAVALMAVVNVWLAQDYLRNLLSTPKIETRDERPPVTRLDPVAVYPSATRVNLLVRDKFLNNVEVSTNPEGVDLTTAERQEFEQSIKKSVTVRPAGKDYPGGSEAACFIPHHFFRYYDAKGTKIGEVEICFCCTGGVASPSLTTRNDDHEVFDVERIKALVKSMKLPTDVNC
jgi:hypothetical protein